MTSATTAHPEEPPADAHDRPQPLAAFLALLLPGLGHAVALRQPRRGALIFTGVASLFLTGLLIGGIDAVDRREDFWWFVGQAAVGPAAFAVDAAHQSLKVVDQRTGRPRSPRPDENPAYEKSIGRLNEIGALACALAGLLNLIAVIDAGWNPGPRRRRP